MAFMLPPSKPYAKKPSAKKARPLIRPQKCLYHKRMAPLFNWMGPQRNYINWKSSPLSLFRSFPPRKKRGAWAIRRCLLLYKLKSSCIKICCIRLFHKIKGAQVGSRNAINIALWPFVVMAALWLHRGAASLTNASGTHLRSISLPTVSYCSIQ